MYLKEIGRYFSSYLWVLNTGLGVVLLCVVSLALCVISPEMLGKYTGIEDVDSFNHCSNAFNQLSGSFCNLIGGEEFMDIAERTTIKQDIFKKQNKPLP